jgi:hypothetical protein
MNIAVVIMEWMQLLEQFYLNCIFPEATIYIADNASTDESIAFVQQHYPAIKIIKIMLILVLLKDIMKH